MTLSENKKSSTLHLPKQKKLLYVYITYVEPIKGFDDWK